MMYREKVIRPASGLFTLLGLIVIALFSFAVITQAAPQGRIGLTVLAAIVLVVSLFLMGGLFIVNPNDAKVLVLFGKYVGTVKHDGFFWANPFLVKRRL